MTQVIPGGPFREFDLSDERRLEPAALLHYGGRERLAAPGRLWLGQVIEGTDAGFEFGKAAKDLLLHRRDEAVLHLAQKQQPTPFVVPDEERVEMVRPWHVAPDHEFLPLIDFELHPGIGPSAGFVDAVHPLGDDALN